MPQYEVRCLNCDVSFPIGTKRCIHCGQRIGSRPRGTPELGYSLTADRDIPLIVQGEPIGPMQPGGEGGADEAIQRSGLRVGMSFVWMLVLIGGLLLRMCSEG